MITSEKLVGSENYLSWSTSVELWFMGQGYEDHFVTQEADIPEAKGLYTNDIQRLYKVASSIVNVRQQDMDLSNYIGQIASFKEEFLTVMPLTTDVGDQRTQINKFFMVLTLIGLCLNLETVRNQILGDSSVPSLDDVFACLLRISSTQNLSSDNTSDSSILVSQTNSRGGRSGNQGRGQRLHCTYCNKLGHTRDRCYQSHGRPPRTAHMAQSFDPQPPQPPSSSTSQGISLIDNEYDDYLRYQATKSTSVAQTSNASACLTHTSSLGRHILSLLYLSLLSFILLSDWSTGKTIGIGRESQGLYHLTSPSTPAVCISTDAPLLIHSRLGHPSLSKFQKMVPRFSSLSSLACESCQLGKHTHISFPKLLNNRAKSPFELVYTDVWGPCRTASTLGFQYFVTFTDDYSRCTWLFLMKNRAELFSIFQKFYAEIQTQFNISIRVLRSDNARAIKCIFLGYSRLQKGYRCYSSETHRYFLSIDVTFFKDSPFFSTFESLPVSEVLPLPIISPPDAVPSRPLQVYHRRHHVVVPPSLAEIPADSLTIPLASPAPTLPPFADLPIVLRKGNRSTRNPHPIYNFLSYHRLSSPYSAFVFAISSVYLPESTPEARSHPGWRQAMVDEMATLHSNGTWDLVVLPSGKSTVVCRWVYTVKVGPDGQIASVCLLLSMAAMHSWPLYQLDIKNAFLHGDLAEKVYMEQPPGFVAHGESGLVCSTADHFVFYHHNSSGQCIYLVVYVDDIVITGSDQNGIQKLKQHLFTHFQTKDLGKLKHFLGIEIAQSSSGVILSQRKTGGAFRRSWEISVTCRTEVIPRLLVTQMQIRAGSPTDRRSTSGYCVFIGGNLISWKSKKQAVVIRSSAEAEYRAMALATCELIWLKHLLRELRFGKDE
ncbi:Retrovirus-related Pol polyprotein from transposon TNT 1-94 [Vitis vinifera]|uniref:Retrovirus-related Pol polyprotein from transposon TNT 1-94 n=1 Tax=Vitis vinifera TaxID=29760 RepID=A0A438HX62_VITVI|nr:Retrovirus-related Pol polyprotein from transposon TNT 1-94 [Vitis vinifera]